LRRVRSLGPSAPAEASQNQKAEGATLSRSQGRSLSTPPARATTQAMRLMKRRADVGADVQERALLPKSHLERAKPTDLLASRAHQRASPQAGRPAPQRARVQAASAVPRRDLPKRTPPPRNQLESIAPQRQGHQAVRALDTRGNLRATSLAHQDPSQSPTQNHRRIPPQRKDLPAARLLPLGANQRAIQASRIGRLAPRKAGLQARRAHIMMGNHRRRARRQILLAIASQSTTRSTHRQNTLRQTTLRQAMFSTMAAKESITSLKASKEEVHQEKASQEAERQAENQNESKEETHQ